MLQNEDRRRTRRWWATAAVMPQYRIHITAIPASDGWIVRLHRRAGACEAYEARCVDGWEAAQEVWEIMAAVDVSSEWTMAIDPAPGGGGAS